MFAARDVIGRWASPSSETIANPDGSVIYGVRDFTLTEKAWALLFHAFGDPGASFRLFTVRVEGTYTLGGESTHVSGAREADFHFTSRNLTLHAPPMLDLFNNAQAAGVAWQAGIEQDVSATGALFLPSVAQAPVEHDLLKLDGDRLFFGDRSGDLTRERPKKLGEPLTRR